MQERLLLKTHKKTLCILILFVLIYICMGVINKTSLVSYATTYTYNISSNDLPADFDSKYPGYRSLLESLVSSHPNWKVKLMETGLEWDSVINNEYQGHGGSPKNLVPSDYSEGWICSICGHTAYDNGNWCCASRAAIEYTMDPRNTLNDQNVFQYLELINDTNITKDQVASMACQISYLNSQNLIDAIYEVANEYNINPFYIIGKILQEQGSNGSILCSGNGYNGNYVGYYNLFNVGASGNTNEEVIMNGLKRAYNKGWDTPQKAIMGGLNLIVNNYIKYGQDTLYFQKFNVVSSPYYSNQYAQNVLDSKSIGTTLRKYYNNSNLLDNSFTFKVPLYLNMPTTACIPPLEQNEATSGELVYINANGGLALKDAPAGNLITYIAQNTEVLVIKRATEKVSGYYWDRVSTPKGIGYMAREAADGSKTYLMPVNTTPNIDVTNNNNYSTPNEDGIIKTEPNTTVNKLKETYSNCVIINKDGTEITGDTLVGTGAKIKIDGVEKYTVVKLGDANGDGKITASDYVKIKNHIMNVTVLDNVLKSGADVNKDGNVTPADYVQIKNHIMKINNITL